MAQGKAQRQKLVPPRKSARLEAVSRSEPSGADGWRKEAERLAVELEAARQEIASLKERQEQVLDRIDWVLDSLDSLTSVRS